MTGIERLRRALDDFERLLATERDPRSLEVIDSVLRDAVSSLEAKLSTLEGFALKLVKDGLVDG